MPELTDIKIDIAKILVSIAAGSWGSVAALLTFAVVSLVVYVKVMRLYKKVIVGENQDRQNDALAKNPLDNKADEAAQKKAEDAVEDELKGGT